MLNRAFQCDHLREKAVGLAYTETDAICRPCCHLFGTLPRFQMSEIQMSETHVSDVWLRTWPWPLKSPGARSNQGAPATLSMAIFSSAFGRASDVSPWVGPWRASVCSAS